MRYAVTADWQADSYMNLSTRDADGRTSRLNDLVRGLQWMTDTALQYGCQTMVVVGDVFESRTTIELPVLDAVASSVEMMSKRMEVHMLPGNHDSYLRNADITSIRIFAGMAKVHTKPEVCGKMAFVPWADDPEQLDRGVCSLLPQLPQYLFTHFLMDGPHAHGKGIPLVALHADKFKQVLLGDVHDPVVLAKNVRYVASLLQIDYRDAGRQRGFTILDDKTNKVEFVENTISPRFHIAKTSADVAKVGAADFVRVKADSPEQTRKVAEQARKKTGWVEAAVMNTEDTTMPRLRGLLGEPLETAVRRYVQQRLEEGLPDGMGEADVELLVTEGLTALAQAKA